MRNKLFSIFGKTALPTLIAGLALAFANPATALAQSRGGGHGGGHSSSAGRSFSGGGGAYRGGGGYAYRGGNRDYRGGYYRGGGYSRGYYGGGYGGGVYLGFGSPYGYAPVPQPAPCGFYDSYGYWHADPACYRGVY